MFDAPNIHLMQIPLTFKSYETFEAKQARMQQEQAPMEVEEEEETSLESVERPTNTRPISKEMIVQNQVKIVNNQKKLKKIFSKMTKFVVKIGRKFGISSSSSSSAENWSI